MGLSSETGAGRRQIISLALATLLACLVLLPLLGHRPLTDWDEGIYAEIAREMLRGGWRALLVPHWNGAPWFEKPPLLFWLELPSLRLFGLTAFAARLPSALAGIASVALLHNWLERRLSTLAAWCTTVLLLSAFGFQHVARAGETDVLLSLGCLIAVLGLSEACTGHHQGWWLFWAGFAFALMTKGAASLTLPLTAAATLAFTRPRPRLGRSFWLGALLFLAAVLPWHLFLYAHFGTPFLRDYLGFHVLGRATAQIEGHHTHPWFYLGVLLVSAPAASLLYPWAIAAAFRRPVLRPLQPLALFALLELALFSAAQTRLPHYIAPVYAPLSALTGAAVALWLRRRQPLRTRGTAQLLAAAILLYAGATALTARPRKALHSPRIANGLLNPDNRESVALLSAARPATTSVPGPLLVLRSGPVVPLQTDAFYARRLAGQVTLTPVPPSIPRDIYYFNPMPLSQAVPPGQTRLLLLDRSLVPQLPPADTFTPLRTGPTETVGLLSAAPAPSH